MGYTYTDRDPSLPDCGWRAVLPHRISPAAVESIAAAEDPIALGMMRGSLASYAGAAGGIVMSLAVAGAGSALDLTWLVALAWGGFAVSGLQVIETRRRARQWLGVIDARLAMLTRG